MRACAHPPAAWEEETRECKDAALACGLGRNRRVSSGKGLQEANLGSTGV